MIGSFSTGTRGNGAQEPFSADILSGSTKAPARKASRPARSRGQTVMSFRLGRRFCTDLFGLWARELPCAACPKAAIRQTGRRRVMPGVKRWIR